MMPWIQLRDYLDFYNEMLYRHHDNTGWLDDSEIFRDIMLEDYGIEVGAGPVGPNRRFYLDDRNYLLFLLKWS